MCRQLKLILFLFNSIGNVRNLLSWITFTMFNLIWHIAFLESEKTSATKTKAIGHLITIFSSRQIIMVAWVYIGTSSQRFLQEKIKWSCNKWVLERIYLVYTRNGEQKNHLKSFISSSKMNSVGILFDQALTNMQMFGKLLLLDLEK